MNKKNLPRTDNVAESFDHKLNKSVGEKHVGDGWLIKFLKDNCFDAEQTLNRFSAEHEWLICIKTQVLIRRNRNNPEELIKHPYCAIT